MPNEDVDRLAQRVIRLVEKDTVEGISSLRPGQRLALDDDLVRRLTPLAENLDLPVRLSPTISKPLQHRHRDSWWHDPSADARRALTELVARSADALEPDPALPPPVDAAARDRMATAVTRAYAANATPRLVEGLLENGRSDDLGRFTPPQLEGDTAAARAMAIAIGARTGTREEDVLRKLVAEGHGGAAYAAADLLVENRPDYRALRADQRHGVRRHLARSIESGFAARDVNEAKQRELTEELENRRADITGGAGTIDTANALANDELARLDVLLDQIEFRPPPPEPDLDQLQALVAEGMVIRVEHHARIDTTLTDEQLKDPHLAAAAAADAMVATSAIPRASRPAAVEATTTMLTEGFAELPTHLAEWRTAHRDLTQEAARYGATLGDRTMAAVRTFEHQPPEPLPDAITTRFATDPALPRAQALPTTTPASSAAPRTTQSNPTPARDR
ncbi:hypothetical protein ACXJJ3_14930 [Kribbella sp. WER1]